MRSTTDERVENKIKESAECVNGLLWSRKQSKKYEQQINGADKNSPITVYNIPK